MKWPLENCGATFLRDFTDTVYRLYSTCPRDSPQDIYDDQADHFRPLSCNVL